MILSTPEKHYKLFGCTKTDLNMKRHFETTRRKRLRIPFRTNVRRYISIYIFITGRSAPSLTIAGRLWSPVRDLGSPRDLWRGETKLHGLIRGVLLGRGAGVHALLATCAESLRLELIWKPEAFPLRGLGPPRTARVWGLASVARSRPEKTTVIQFCSGGPE